MPGGKGLGMYLGCAFEIGHFVGYYNCGQKQAGADEHKNCNDYEANQYERLIVVTGFFDHWPLGFAAFPQSSSGGNCTRGKGS